MGQPTTPPPVLLVLAAFSRHDAALAWVRARAEEAFGPVLAQSETFGFAETNYYAPTMGSDLRKCFLGFERLVDPGELAAIKLRTNDWEREYAELARHPEPRPLNLDPGYLTLAKLVLASTKDHAHRIYLAQGIFAEVTLSYRDGAWHVRDWTFPDYQRADYHLFFERLRRELRARLGSGAAT